MLRQHQRSQYQQQTRPHFHCATLPQHRKFPTSYNPKAIYHTKRAGREASVIHDEG